MEFQEKLIKLNQAFENKEEAIRYCGRLLVEAGQFNEAYVNFGTQENPKVVTVLFGIAGLGDEHLEIIQKISIFCADVDNVVKLADAQSVEEVIRLLNNVE